MCPSCIESTALMVAGAASTGGILAVCIGKVRHFFRGLTAWGGPWRAGHPAGATPRSGRRRPAGCCGASGDQHPETVGGDRELAGGGQLDLRLVEPAGVAPGVGESGV